MGAGALFLKGVDFKLQGQHAKTREKWSNVDKTSDQLLQPSTMTTITDTGSTRSHLRAITASKQQKSQSHPVWDGDVPRSTWRRRPRPLFQYKYYSEQQPLRLSNAEIEEVMSAFCSDGPVLGSNTSGIFPSLPAVQPGRGSIEAADVAGSVLIKLILDMYLSDARTASPLTLSLLEGMLGSSNVAVRVRLFDLLLNLGIHAHLLEPVQMEEQAALEDSTVTSGHLGIGTPFSSSRRGLNLEEVFRAEEKTDLLRPKEETGNLKGPIIKVDSGTPKAVKIFEVWLLQILFEMLLFLVQMGEKEEGVWVAALSCLLYFICDRGKVQRQRLNGLDVRVLKALINVSWEHAWADELQSSLVCMMSNLFYRIPAPEDNGLGRKAVFDVEKLELLGGIDFICSEFARAKSIEAKHNLFAILTDYVVHRLNSNFSASGKACPGFEDIQAVTSALSLAGAPEALGLAFKHGLKNVGKGLFKSITEAMSRDVDSGRLNSALLEEVTTMFDVLVASYIQPDEEFSELISITIISEGLSNVQSDSSLKECSLDSNTITQSWATLHALLHSPVMSCRNHGYSWLADLLFLQLTHGGVTSISSFDTDLLQEQSWFSKHDEENGFEKINGSTSSGNGSALRLFYGLLRSRHAYVRRGFIFVLERLLFKCQQMAMDSYLMDLSSREPRQDVGRRMSAEKWVNFILNLMNEVLYRIVSANDTDRINILQMCNVMLSQLCVVIPPSASGNPSNTYLRENMVFNRFGSKDVSNGRPYSYFLESERQDSKKIGDGTNQFKLSTIGTSGKHVCGSISMAAMLLNGQAAAPKALVSSMATDLLYWPLLELAGAATEDIVLGVAVGSQGKARMAGGASDVRAALLILLIGKCSVQQSAFEEVGGEEFFRSLLDDMDARVAYYTASFLLKRMMTEEPEKYQRVLHSLVFRAQQSNNEKLLENPYLQMRGILQLSNDLGSLLSFQEA